MRRLAIWLMLWALAVVSQADYLGSWAIDDYVTFVCNTHNASTGAATDADAAPTYRIYEDETATPIVTGTMALLDDVNTTGFYSDRIQLTAASGFEVGKSYTVYISATVATVTATKSDTFQILASTNVETVKNAEPAQAGDIWEEGASVKLTLTADTHTTTQFTISTTKALPAGFFRDALVCIRYGTGRDYEGFGQWARVIWSTAMSGNEVTLTISPALSAAPTSVDSAYILWWGVRPADFPRGRL